MTENHLIQLISRHLSKELSEEEIKELKEWADIDPENWSFLDRVTDEDLLERELELWRNIDVAAAYVKLKTLVQTQRRRAAMPKIIAWSAAAVLIIAVSIIGLNKRPKNLESNRSAMASISQPVSPGRNTARLTLSNGQEILLDSAANGILARQGTTQIKNYSGSLIYRLSGEERGETVAYNTLATPRSGQYQLTLPDGSRVWLNNVSSLHYPTNFRGKIRTVELNTGEAYFEIAKDPLKPFIVKVKGENITVLGTSFNIMAYPEEESTQTTLLSGAIKVETAKTSVLLNPDEQLQVWKDGVWKVGRDVPSQDVISWKNGFFYFGRASFAAVMRQLARWYDVKVIYQGKVPDMEFGGKIDRNLPLQELLKFLDKNQVRFRVEGHNLIVLPS